MAFSERLALWARCPAKSSVQSWVGGLESCLLQISRPLGQQRPVLWSEAGVPLRLGDSRGQDDHVARFLHRHLVVFGLLSSPVNLTVRQRVSAQVVRRERKMPSPRSSIVEDGHHGTA